MIFARDWDSDVIREYADHGEAERDFRLLVRKAFNRIPASDSIKYRLYGSLTDAQVGMGATRVLRYDHTNKFNFGGD